MQAGRMKYSVTLLEPSKTTNEYGEEAVEYVETRTIHAERIKTTGNRSEEVGEHFPDYSAEFNVRDSHPVEENWRLQQKGGYLYTITNIIPNIDRGMKTLICVRVNE